jgi:hypothetical protein
MKTIQLVLLGVLMLLDSLANAQKIELVPNLSENDKGFWGNGLLKNAGDRLRYKSNLYFNYIDSRSKQLAKFDGEKITLATSVSRPDCFTGPDFVLKDFLYLGICDNNNQVQLAKYDGAKVLTAIANPTGFEFQTKMVTMNEVSYLSYYETIKNRSVLCRFDGEKVEIIPNSTFGSDSILIFNNTVCFDHIIGQQTDQEHQLGVYDGEKVILISNPSTQQKVILITPLIVFNHSLFIDYKDAWGHYLGKFDGQNVQFIPNPAKSWIYYNYRPIIYKNKLFIIGYVGDLTSKGGELQLAFLDGDKISLIHNPKNGNCGTDALIVFKDCIYFGFYNPDGNSQQLAKYDGVKISFIPNLSAKDVGLIGNMLIYNNDLYFGYEDSLHKKHLATFDGTVIKLLPNPDGGNGFQDNMKTFNSTIIFDYKNSDGKVQIGTLK